MLLLLNKFFVAAVNKKFILCGVVVDCEITMYVYVSARFNIFHVLIVSISGFLVVPLLYYDASRGRKHGESWPIV